MFAEHLGFSLCSVYPLLFPHQIGWALLPDPATQFENRFHLSVLHPGLRKPGPRIHIGSGASWALISLCSPRQLQLPSPTSPTSQPHQQPALRFVTEEIYVTCLALHLCGSPTSLAQHWWVSTTTLTRPTTGKMGPPSSGGKSSAPSPAPLDTTSTKDTFIPLFSGAPQDYKEWRKRIHIYFKKMELTSRRPGSRSLPPHRRHTLFPGIFLSTSGQGSGYHL